METQLTFEPASKELGLAFKQKLQTDSNLVLKVRGQINTKKGTIDHSGYLRKFFFSRAPVKDPTRNDIISYKEQFALGAGVEYTSRSEDVLLGLVAKKGLKLPGRDAWLKGVAQADYNTSTRQAWGSARVQASKCIFDFTDTQDLRLVIGYRATVDPDGNVFHAPYGQVRENNWTLNTDFKGWVGLRYDL